MMPDPDADLVRRACGGDREAFAALLERHYDRLHRIVWRITGSREDAEDIVQEICCALATKIDGFRGEAKVSTWLSGIAVNAARDHLRRIKARQKATDGFAMATELYPQPDGRDLYRAQWLKSILATLDEALRETVILVSGAGLSHKEAALALGVAESTVSWRMHEVRKLLRRENVHDAGMEAFNGD